MMNYRAKIPEQVVGLSTSPFDLQSRDSPNVLALAFITSWWNSAPAQL
jgi:hypothetical protein